MKWVFLESPHFTRHRESCFADDEDYRNFQNELMDDPERWGVVPEATPVRKARWGTGGKGRSGGIRVLYFQIPEADLIVLVAAYPKSKQANLSMADMLAIGRYARELRQIIVKKGPGGRRGGKHGKEAE